MYHNLTVPQTCETLWQECRALVPELIRGCSVQASDQILDAGSVVEPEPDTLYLIKDGELFESFDGQLIAIYEKGDLVNADALAHAKITRYETDFAVTVDKYSGTQFMQGINSDQIKMPLWSRYLTCLIQSYQILTSHFSRQDTDYLPEFRQYRKGDVIIEEDTDGDEVFTLLNGTAKVMRKGEEVGEIEREEIFGAIAALTNTPRTATIIATSDCDTLVAKSENFQSIFETRPDLVHKLIHDMARTIISSNERIVELSKDKG